MSRVGENANRQNANGQNTKWFFGILFWPFHCYFVQLKDNDDGGDNKSEFHDSDKIPNHVGLLYGLDKMPWKLRRTKYQLTTKRSGQNHLVLICSLAFFVHTKSSSVGPNCVIMNQSGVGPIRSKLWISTSLKSDHITNKWPTHLKVLLFYSVCQLN